MAANDRILLVCDIDGTLYYPEHGNPGLEEFSAWLEAHRGRVVFAVNSGRSLDEIAMVAECGPLPRPDWIISDMGTAISRGFTPDTAEDEWASLMARDWGRDEIRDLLSSVPGLREQEAWHQHPAKLSYYLDDDSPAVLERVASNCSGWNASSGLSCKISSCLGIYLDILPSWGGKGSPVLWLGEKLGIPETAFVVAGDAGNDRDMMERGWKTILVANHSEELADLASLPGVYLSVSPSAAGVLEYLRKEIP